MIIITNNKRDKLHEGKTYICIYGLPKKQLLGMSTLPSFKFLSKSEAFHFAVEKNSLQNPSRQKHLDFVLYLPTKHFESLCQF